MATEETVVQEEVNSIEDLGVDHRPNTEPNLDQESELSPDAPQGPGPEPAAAGVNYANYGYRNSDMLQIPSVLFFKVLTMARLMEQKETEVYYEQKDTMEGTFSQDNKPIPLATRLGMEAKAIGHELNQLHMNNVDNGIATPLDVLQAEAAEAQKSQVTLEEGN